MIRRALVQENGGGRLEPESASLLAGLRALGVPVELFTAKMLQRRRVSLARDTLVAGEVPVVQLALRYLEIPVPELSDYPAVLAPFLKRRVWESTLGAVIDGLHEGRGAPVFVKPRDRKKRFAGVVLGSPDDLSRLEGASRQTPVLCSEVVEWRSEHRVYVIEGEVVGMKPYAGDASVVTDQAVVADALAWLAGTKTAPAAYGIDLGVLANGETALVELNDGYGLGSYGLADEVYTRLIVTRWEELAQAGERKPPDDSNHLDMPPSGL